MGKIGKYIVPAVVILVVIIVSLLLVLTNTNTFVTGINRIKEIINIKNLECFFEKYLTDNKVIYEVIVSDIEESIGIIADNIDEMIHTDKSFGEVLLDFLFKTLNFIFNFLIYFCNIGVNVIFVSFIFLNETFNATKLSIKYSKPALVYIKIVSGIQFIIRKIKKLIIRFLKFLKSKKRIIALASLIFLLSSGLLFNWIVEFLIFAIVYIYRSINQELYLLIIALFKYAIILLFPILKNIPVWVLFIMLFILLFLKAVSKAEYRLLKNHERLKNFVRDTLTQTCFINGAPGTGKTLLNVSLSLAAEEVFIEELERRMLEYEVRYDKVNFATVRNGSNKDHPEYFKLYEQLTTRKTYIISNYAIYSPYFKDFSKIFDFSFMRKNKQAKVYALEKYNIISISELDKE